MKLGRLQKLEIENFRSINDRLICRLDAPVVLIHGHNGAGKTSLLSAIELALTGQIASLARVDTTYREQLLNYGAKEGHVHLSVEEIGAKPLEIDVNIDKKGPKASGGLPHGLAQFFSERCFLAQSSLSQLLSIYEGSGSALESPLSKFVSELIGLDRLDALELGLAKFVDLRNAKKLASTYLAVERERIRLKAELGSRSVRNTQAAAERRASAEQFDDVLRRLQPFGLSLTANSSDLESTLNSDAEQTRLAQLTDLERSTSSIRRRYQHLQSIRVASPMEALEIAFADAQNQLSVWRDGVGVEINRLFQTATDLGLQSPRSMGPRVGDELRTYRELWDAELQRLEQQLTDDRKASERRSILHDELAAFEGRLSNISGQISAITDDVGGLSGALAAVLPHIHGPNCPVCQRDYSEISKEPLVNVLAIRISELGDLAERLAQLNRDYASTERGRAELEREAHACASLMLSDEDRLRVQDRTAKLRMLLVAAERLQSSATLGTEFVDKSLNARNALEAYASSDNEELLLHSSIEEIATGLGFEIIWTHETTETALKKAEEEIGRQMERLSSLYRLKQNALGVLDQLSKHSAQAELAAQDLTATSNAANKVEQAFASAERTRSDIRTVFRAVGVVRGDVISSVFNDRLNLLWRDLFVRLAPSETFIPKFSLPPGGETRGVRTWLRTITGTGHEGGAPGTMLSAGNLNTAALTLFLALHLSVEPKIPWLVLDDPVQSMDEVHIAQFAALLRTLSKEHGRQILLAVHERPLFEYLTLELSPAFEGDELITIDLRPSSAHRTRIDTRRQTFEPDVSLNATAA